MVRTAPRLQPEMALGMTGIRSQFCSEGRRPLINTSYARPAGPINVGLGPAAPGLPGRPYIPAFIFFFFGDYGNQSRKNLTGGTRLIKNPPRLAIRSPWRAFHRLSVAPGRRGKKQLSSKAKAGTARTSRAAPALARLIFPHPFMIQHNFPPKNLIKK